MKNKYKFGFSQRKRKWIIKSKGLFFYNTIFSTDSYDEYKNYLKKLF